MKQMRTEQWAAIWEAARVVDRTKDIKFEILRERMQRIASGDLTRAKIVQLASLALKDIEDRR